MWRPILLTALLAACSSSTENAASTEGAAEPARTETPMTTEPRPDSDASPDARDEAAVATFGAGCFWCVEAVLEQLDGVHAVVSGYMGGEVDDPTYKQVCSGSTGHAEVVQVEYDPNVISYDELLSWFWRLHDPTTLNRQGNDLGTQYRSVIFFHDADQERLARASKQAENESGRHYGPIVTEISAASTFYPAEDYHQDYYRANASQGYCRMVIAPKLDKLGLEK